MIRHKFVNLLIRVINYQVTVTSSVASASGRLRTRPWSSFRSCVQIRSRGRCCSRTRVGHCRNSVGVPPFVPVAATNTASFPDLVDLYPFSVDGNFLLSSLRAYSILFCSGVREVLTKNAGFWDLHAAKISCTKSRWHNLKIMLHSSGPLVPNWEVGYINV